MKMIDSVDILRQELLDAFQSARKICFLTHRNPDGDGLPACLMLKLICEHAAGKHADIVLEDPAANIYDFLGLKEHTRVYDDSLDYDLVVILDCHEASRLGKCLSLLETASAIITVDHHEPGVLIEDSVNYIDTREVSVGAIIFRAFADDITPMPPQDRLRTVNAAYTTILNDTDFFVNSNTDHKAFALCSEMAMFGMNPSSVAREFIFGQTLNEIQLTGAILNTIDTYLDGAIMFFHVTRDMLRKYDQDRASHSRISRWVKGARGVIVSTFFRQVGEDHYRLSLRSEYIDVNAVARMFGGGGHVRASGCDIRGELNAVKSRLLEALKPLVQAYRS